jgi:hypothetical protein
MKTNNCARYLLLFGSKESPRAALFDHEERLLAEMIDEDGFLVDSLLRQGRAVRPTSKLVPVPICTFVASRSVECGAGTHPDAARHPVHPRSEGVAAGVGAGTHAQPAQASVCDNSQAVPQHRRHPH